MSKILKILLMSLLFQQVQCVGYPKIPEDNLTWLEDESERTKAWVVKQNKKTRARLTQTSSFRKSFKIAKSILQDQSKVQTIKIHGDFAYTLVQSKASPRGVWKRKPVSNFKKSQWESVLSFDELSRKEKKKLNFSEAKCLEPEARYCLLGISAGGADEVEVREFDTKKKVFVKDGFQIPSSKAAFDWLAEDQIVFTSSFGSQRISSAGFSQELKRLGRGKDLHRAETILSTGKDYLTAFPITFPTERRFFTVAHAYKSEAQNEYWFVSTTGKPILSPTPTSSRILGILKGEAIVVLNNDWKIGDEIFPAGNVVSFPIQTVMRKKSLASADISLVYQPPKNTFVTNSFSLKNFVTKDFVNIEVVSNVKSLVVKVEKVGGVYRVRKKRLDSNVKLQDSSFTQNISFLIKEDFLTPKKLVKKGLATGKRSVVQTANKLFETEGMVTEQRWAKSADGTLVPYFLMGQSRVIKNGNAPVILRGYGAYGISSLPFYDPIQGKLWLEAGGLIAVANVRGGGELGGDWHRSATKKHKIRSVHDFIAVAEDLLEKKVTNSNKLGAYGGSMGGLLVASAIVMRPDLFKAVHTAVPVIDVIRGKKLVKGNWVGEVGNPEDPEERSYILAYSPYHNVKPTVKYPSYFSYTPKNDDRVMPGNSRKMVKRLDDSLKPEVYYYEDSEGGHGVAANSDSRALWKTMFYEFFRQELMSGRYRTFPY